MYTRGVLEIIKYKKQEKEAVFYNRFFLITLNLPVLYFLLILHFTFKT